MPPLTVHLLLPLRLLRYCQLGRRLYYLSAGRMYCRAVQAGTAYHLWYNPRWAVTWRGV